MLDRRPTSDPEVVEVTFRLPVEVGAQVVHVVGDFNEWSRDATPLERDGDRFSVTLELRAGSTYQFRYLLDGHVWENDWAADDYVGNEFGGENSLLDLTNGSDPGRSAAATPQDGEVATRGLHAVGAMDEPELAAIEGALAVDSLATEAQTVSEAASVLTPVAEGGLAAPRAEEARARSGKDDPPTKRSKASGSTKARGSKGSGSTKAKGSKGSGSTKAKGSTTTGSKAKSSTSSKAKAKEGASSSSPTKAELLDAAKELDISGRSKMNKDELEKAVAAARKG